MTPASVIGALAPVLEQQRPQCAVGVAIQRDALGGLARLDDYVMVTSDDDAIMGALAAASDRVVLAVLALAAIERCAESIPSWGWVA